MKGQRFKISRWIMMSLAILSNAFIIVFSSLSDEATAAINRPFTDFFVNLINGITKKEVKTVPLESINAYLSNEEGYVYNYLPGYAVDEIPLGSAKQIEYVASPEDATNKTVSYTVNPSGAVSLSQDGSKFSVVGLKTGDCSITFKSNDGGFESVVPIKVVETIAPVSYEIALDNTEIPIGSTETISFDIDGGVLTHDELINFRYYDIRKLTYESSNESVATVDENGVIYPHIEGNATISVSNGGYSKSLNISVTSGTTPTPYSSLSISGTDVCYENDMILDQSSKKNHFQLTPKDGETELNPEDFIWSSSNELIAKVDKHGVLRGFRKPSNEDEVVTITAKSKLTGQTITKEVNVKFQIPTLLLYSLTVGDKQIWNPTIATMAMGDKVKLNCYFEPYRCNKTIELECSDSTVISTEQEGTTIQIILLKEGMTNLKVKSLANPSLSFEIQITVVPAGAISGEDVPAIRKTIRKSLGHAAMFMVAQVFTFLTLYMFFYDKKWWFYSAISVGSGLFIAGLSELIQFFIPSRDGTFIDVLIDFAGVVVGAALTFLGIYIVKKIKEKKSQKETTENK